MDSIEFREYIKANMRHNKEEARIVNKVVKALKAAGNPVTEVWYDRTGDEAVKVSNLTEVQNEVFNLDEAYLITKDGDWVFIVNGNGWDALTDYTTDIEAVIDPIIEWINKHN